MANYREMYCEHCKRHTTFYLESDLIWYCDKCGNAYGSMPLENMDDFDNDDDIGDIIRCPYCNNLVEVDNLINGYICPVCFEDLSIFMYEEGEE